MIRSCGGRRGLVDPLIEDGDAIEEEEDARRADSISVCYCKVDRCVMLIGEYVNDDPVNTRHSHEPRVLFRAVQGPDMSWRPAGT